MRSAIFWSRLGELSSRRSASGSPDNDVSTYMMKVAASRTKSETISLRTMKTATVYLLTYPATSLPPLAFRTSLSCGAPAAGLPPGHRTSVSVLLRRPLVHVPADGRLGRVGLDVLQ